MLPYVIIHLGSRLYHVQTSRNALFMHWVLYLLCSRILLEIQGQIWHDNYITSGFLLMCKRSFLPPIGNAFVDKRECAKLIILRKPGPWMCFVMFASNNGLLYGTLFKMFVDVDCCVYYIWLIAKWFYLFWNVWKVSQVCLTDFEKTLLELHKLLLHTIYPDVY